MKRLILSLIFGATVGVSPAWADRLPDFSPMCPPCTMAVPIFNDCTAFPNSICQPGFQGYQCVTIYGCEETPVDDDPSGGDTGGSGPGGPGGPGSGGGGPADDVALGDECEGHEPVLETVTYTCNGQTITETHLVPRCGGGLPQDCEEIIQQNCDSTPGTSYPCDNGCIEEFAAAVCS